MKSKSTKVFKVIMIIAMLSVGKVNGQDFKDRFFFSNGISIYTEMIFGRSILTVDSYDSTTYYYSDAAVKTSLPMSSIFTYTANFRYNLTEMNDNSSLSLNIPLGLGLMISEYGVGNLNIPLFLGFNSGNISTYSTDKNKGFTIAVGYEYYNVALFRNSDYKNIPTALDGASFLQPCANLGFRYWNKKNIAKEFNLKVGFGPAATTIARGVEYDLGKPVTVKLTWFKYKKY